MNMLEAYLKEIRDIRSTGAAVAETSYYPALSNLLNAIGKTLKPKVRCVITIANRGAGIPDGGLFTADQVKKDDPNPLAGLLPARGVLEVKGPAEDVHKIASSAQVKKYSDKYGLVLVTNYRDFLLLGRDVQGNPLPMEGFTLADSAPAWWQLAAHPQKASAGQGEQFCEYLMRVMLSVAPLSAPQDVAWFLASYARTAKARVENHKDLSALAAVRDALEEALGMKFAGEKGEHFFRSTLVQTIFYGVFSAWVLWHRERPGRTDAFNWRESAWTLRVPFISALYEQVATASKLGPLGLVEVLDWTAGALNRVDRAAFFQKFQDEHAVQYFYEPFLEAFDPDLRKELGVWYTPPEIVQYQVARVDTVLREELGLADGLADPNVVVLDPCCGTGAYLVEVLKKIAQTLKAKGGDALMASDLKKAAITRVFGFEILPSPFVVSHLQLGLMLHDLGAPLSAKGDKQERVGVYLTNSLTGWEPPKGAKKHLPFPGMEEERDAAEKVKREARVLVILGNPPYNAFAGVSPDEEQGLVEPYKKDLNSPPAAGGWGIKKFNLDDLYIRFFRLAERRIAEMSGKGVVSFISNFSYLSDPSFVVMRQRFLGEFDGLWFDCMNGDSRETGKLTPEGKSDPSVFSTEYNREGIRVGTTVCVLVRRNRVAQPPPAGQPGPGEGEPSTVPQVRFRHFWGTDKRELLLESLQAQPRAAVPHYTLAAPTQENRYSFRPEEVSAAFMSWPKLPDLCGAAPSNGLMEKRGGALIDIDKAALEARMKDYFNTDLSWEDYKARQTALVEAQAGFEPAAARKKALAAEDYEPKRLLRYALRPFETRWCYYTQVNPVWNRARPSLWEQCFDGNAFLVARPSAVASPEGVPIYFTGLLGDNDFQRGHAYYFPLRLAPTGSGNGKQATMFKADPKANLSAAARAYLAGLGIEDVDHVAQPPSAGQAQAKPTPWTYQRNLPHIQSDKPLYITFCTQGRWVVPEEVRHLVIRHCLHDHGRKYWLHSVMVMPDHVHLILSLYRDSAGSPFGLPEIMNGIKGASAHSINKALGRKGSVWQDESFDHVLRSSESVSSKAEYIWNNPVRKGLVGKPEEWQWFWAEWMELPGSTAEGGCATGSGSTAKGCATHELIWMHALAVGYSPAYLAENADGIRGDWPRIPLPDARKALEASAELGRQVAALLDTEADVPTVTAGKIEPIFRTIGALAKVGGGTLDPDAGDLAVTARWGHAGKDGVTMPAKGRIVVRAYDKAERDALADAAAARGLTLERVISILGADTRDVYLNENAYWRNVPANVWEYYIGGYQVIKKWLSYREQELLGRAMSADEAREVTGMARRLAGLVLLQPALDANYRQSAQAAYAWPREG